MDKPEKRALLPLRYEQLAKALGIPRGITICGEGMSCLYDGVDVVFELIGDGLPDRYERCVDDRPDMIEFEELR